ncbi:SDR family oxidoreductase [Streptomyces sp. bgisy034]|uniref:SDR family oxidoreductase n=1 Tax=Streptomyces sp. bgisy034 TaxID=3413774 RepID=UPI003EC02B63
MATPLDLPVPRRRESRLRVLAGDLADERLGLTEERFDGFARTVDAVHHTGATVHWLHPDEALRAASVHGTREILRLAARGAGPGGTIHVRVPTDRAIGRRGIGEDRKELSA